MPSHTLNSFLVPPQMSSTTRKEILFPIGRLVRGSLYEGQDTDAEGNPLKIKSGPNAGQPRVDFYFAVAFPKTPGHSHWAQSEWGAVIWAAGHAAFPQAAQSEAFAWKVVDGDSVKPNRKGKKPCDNEGYKGHWVVQFSSGFAPRIFSADGTQQITDPGAVKLGYFVQVYGSVDGNGSAQQPGVFVNHNMVALAGYGPEIVVGPDATAVGFGKGPAPAGMMSAPAGGGFNPAPGVPVPAFAAPPAVPAAAVPPAAVPAVPAPAVPVTPNPAILAVPGVPAAPVAPPPAAPQMTAKAGGVTYEQYLAANWTHAQMVQHGLVVA